MHGAHLLSSPLKPKLINLVRNPQPGLYFLPPLSQCPATHLLSNVSKNPSQVSSQQCVSSKRLQGTLCFKTESVDVDRKNLGSTSRMSNWYVFFTNLHYRYPSVWKPLHDKKYFIHDKKKVSETLNTFIWMFQLIKVRSLGK